MTFQLPMKRKTDRLDAMAYLEPREAPDASKLITALEQDVRDMGPWLYQLKKNDEIRECVWAGQSEDGRKHEDDLGEPAQPWEGASDAQVPLADEIVNENVKLCMAALRAARLNVVARNAKQAGNAALITPVMNYTVGTLLRSGIGRQGRLLADWAETGGMSLMHVRWHKERAIEPREITIDDLEKWALQMLAESSEVPTEGAAEPGADEAAQEAQEAQMQMQVERTTIELQMLALDPKRRNELVRLIQQFDPAVEEAEARRVASALQQGKPGIYYAVYVRESRPLLEACQVGIDVIMPALTFDVQRAPRIARLHWLTRSEVEDQAELEEWNAEALKQLLDHPGRVFNSTIYDTLQWAMAGAGVRYGVTTDEAARSGMYQVIELFHRMPTKAGVPCVYRTLLHASCSKVIKHEVLKDSLGKYPFKELVREHRKKVLLSSRGVPQKAQAWQNSMKLHHDAHDDRTVLDTTPPIKVNAGKFTEAFPLKPWAQLPMSRSSDFEWMNLPERGYSPVEMKQDLREQVDRHFGRMSQTVPPALSQLHQQDLTSNFLITWSEILGMIFGLMQQYMDPIVEARVAGMAVPLNASREDIQGQYDLELSFDVKELDLDFLMKKFKMLGELAFPFDSEGVIKRGEFVKYVFAAVDPVMAGIMVKDANAASQDEEEDETRNLSAVMNGLEPPYKMGQNHRLRLAQLQKLLQTNPRAAAIMNADENQLDPESMLVRQLLTARAEFHQQQVTQDENKVIGRLGTKPVLEGEAA